MIVALATSLAALASTWLLFPLVDHFGLLLPSLTAVVLAAMYGGARAGIVTTILTVLVIDYFFVPPLQAIGSIDRRQLMATFLYLVACGLMILLSNSWRKGQAAGKELAEARIAAAKAETQVRTREQLLAIVSHELRNPLAVMLMGVRVLQTQAALDTDQSRDLLARIDRSAHQMKRLVNDLLDFSRIDVAKLPLSREAVPVSHILSQLAQNFAAAAEARQVSLDVTAPDDLPAIWADEQRLAQVLGNLVDNALKFTPVGSTIRVVAAQADGAVHFSVTDQGPGLSREGRAKIFEPFWQAERGSHMGLGLGLPIAKGIVEAHGGRIWVESPPGSGLQVHFTIPLAESRRASAGDDRPGHPDSRAAS